MISKTKIMLSKIVLIFCMEAHAITIHHSDFIDNSAQTGFNGFEGMPSTSDWNSAYIEENIRVEQLGVDAGNIWTRCIECGQEGERSWYPNGTDYGYTQITLENGNDFDSIGFVIGTGFLGGADILRYELFNDGVSVLEGSFDPLYQWRSVDMDYLGFSGGGFDTIWLRDAETIFGDSSFGSGVRNGLTLDSIEIQSVAQVPEPNILYMILTGLFFLTNFGIADNSLTKRSTGPL